MYKLFDLIILLLRVYPEKMDRGVGKKYVKGN